MTGLTPGASVLIVSHDPTVSPLHATILRRLEERCTDCGGSAWHVELASGGHANFCESVMRRPN